MWTKLVAFWNKILNVAENTYQSDSGWNPWNEPETLKKNKRTRKIKTQLRSLTSVAYSSIKLLEGYYCHYFYNDLYKNSKLGRAFGTGVKNLLVMHTTPTDCLGLSPGQDPGPWLLLLANEYPGSLGKAELGGHCRPRGRSALHSQLPAGPGAGLAAAEMHGGKQCLRSVSVSICLQTNKGKFH